MLAVAATSTKATMHTLLVILLVSGCCRRRRLARLCIVLVACNVMLLRSSWCCCCCNILAVMYKVCARRDARVCVCEIQMSQHLACARCADDDDRSRRACAVRPHEKPTRPRRLVDTFTRTRSYKQTCTILRGQRMHIGESQRDREKPKARIRQQQQQQQQRRAPELRRYAPASTRTHNSGVGDCVATAQSAQRVRSFTFTTFLRARETIIKAKLISFWVYKVKTRARAHTHTHAESVRAREPLGGQLLRMRRNKVWTLAKQQRRRQRR